MGSGGGGTEHMQRISTVVLGLMLGAGLLATACVPPPTPPADSGRYVATTGTDTGTCKKSAAPCRTINYAVSQAVAGETVRVAAGTYPELVTVDKGLTFLGANAGKRAGLSPAVRTAESVVKGFRSPGAPHPDATQSFSVTIDGFSIDPQGDPALLAPATQHLVSLFGGPQVIVRNNLLDGGSYVSDCGYDCTTMTDAAVMVQSGTYAVKDNSFTDFRSPVDVTQFDPAHPIVSGTISGNSFTRYTNRAVWVREDGVGGPFPGTISISGNLFDASGWTSDTWSPAGIVMTSGGNTVTGNTFAANGSGVFDQVCDGTNVAGVSNTFTDNSFLSNRSGIQLFVVGSCGTGEVDPVVTGNRFEGTFTGVGLVDEPEIGVRWNGAVGTNGDAAPSVISAECNWWGAGSGPDLNGAPLVPGATAITLNVDATPWNTTAAGPCDGS